MKSLHRVAFTILIIGGLNWLVLALVGWDIGDLFGGQDAVVSRIIYILFGLSAIFEAVTHTAECRDCGRAGAPAGA